MTSEGMLRVGCLVWSAMVAGCSGLPTAPPSAEAEPAPCPDTIRSDISLHVSISPAEVPSPLAPAEGTPQGRAVLGRKLLISVVPGSSARKLKIVDSTLSIMPFGGTFAEWGTLEGATAGLDIEPGRLRVKPILADGPLHAQTLTVDTVIRAGGAPLEQAAVMTGAMWDAERRPVPADSMQITLVPLRHVSEFEMVEATLALELVTQPSRSQPQWTCAVETRAMLVDQEAARPPLWDLGTSFRGGSRKLWLALYDPRTGPVRAIFTNPVAARGFALWAQQTGATHVGTWQLGVFQQDESREVTSVVPADRTIMATWRPVSAEDLAQLKVGPLAEP